MTAPEVTPSVERGAHAALYTKEDGFGLWEPVKVLSLAWAADDVSRAHAPVRVILSAALDVEEMARALATEAWITSSAFPWEKLTESERDVYRAYARRLRAKILGESGEADPGLLLILLGAGLAVLAGAAVLAFATGVFG